MSCSRVSKVSKGLFQERDKLDKLSLSCSSSRYSHLNWFAFAEVVTIFERVKRLLFRSGGRGSHQIKAGKRVYRLICPDDTMAARFKIHIIWFLVVDLLECSISMSQAQDLETVQSSLDVCLLFFRHVTYDLSIVNSPIANQKSGGCIKSNSYHLDH
jgi:hypothetical protein